MSNKSKNEILDSAESKIRAPAIEVEPMIFPYPDAVSEGPWDLKRGPVPFNDKKKKTMQVPTEPDIHSELARLHEIGHLAITPSIPEENLFMENQVGAAADLHLGLCLEAMGYDISQGVLDPVRIASDPSIVNKWTRLPLHEKVGVVAGVWPEKRTRGLLLSLSGGEAEEIVKHCESILALMGTPDLDCRCPDCKERAEEDKKKIPHIPLENILDVGRYIYKLDPDNPPPPPGPEKKPGEGTGKGEEGKSPPEPSKQAKCPHETSPFKRDGRSEDEDGNPVSSTYKYATPYRYKAIPRWSSPDSSWGDMYIETPPRIRRIKPRGRLAPAKIAQDVGTIPERSHLWPITKKIYVRKIGHPLDTGGAILIDASGSMCMTREMIQELVDVCPAATIAAYGGSGNFGELRVYVKNGQICDIWDIKVPGHGQNVIDGPALEWLASQDSPRIWISDGGITGKYDEDPSPTMRDEVKAIMKRYKIVRYGSIGDALTALHVARKEGGEVGETKADRKRPART